MTSLVLAAVMALPPMEDAPTVFLAVAKPKVAVNSSFKATVRMTFPDGLHGYQNPPTDSFQIPVVVTVPTKGFKLVKASYPEGIDFEVAGESKPSRVYEGTIEIPITVKTVKLKPGNYSLDVEVNYQQCNESACFPPGTVKAKAKLTVVKAVKP